MKEQIEEMAKVIANKTTLSIIEATGVAEILTVDGYRKQSVGEWKPQMQELGYCDTLECSLCGFVIDVSQGDYKFCPNCGAKMKGGRNENGHI